jgi:hypothetical protein
LKIAILNLLCFFSAIVGFSQSTKVLNGRVFCDKIFLGSVEVVNETKKTVVLSNNQGNFSINVSQNDVLFFLSKKHTIKKITINTEILNASDFVVDLEIKPIELDEVEIVNLEKVNFKVKEVDVDAINISKNANRPKNNIYTGEIENGIDFVRIGKMIFKIFKRKKIKSDDSASKIDFKTYIKSNFNTSYFIKNLDLKVEEISWFLEYCNSDPNSKKVVQTSNILNVMDFLLSKRKEIKIE